MIGNSNFKYQLNETLFPPKELYSYYNIEIQNVDLNYKESLFYNF